ncbi:general substrate transporter [Aspergillus multicolor]|uniref:general substrate transporter n=1 Tax=Aspergillus multicolor TaxID=41759 RepID=UPI003CCCCB48
MVGQITATYDLGCFLGAIACMGLGDYFGRCQMLVGRLISGVGNGINTTTIPVWQSEMSKPHHRGRLIVLQLALNQLGNVTAQWPNFGLGFIDHRSVSWRFPLAFQIFYALLAAAAIPWLPDSPRWLIQRNRETEARAVLARLYNKASNPNDPLIATLHDTAVRSVHHELELAAALNWRVLFHKDRLHTGRRWGGINVINYYLPAIFASLSVSRTFSLVLSCCNSMNLMFSTCLGALFIDSIGRKRLMLLGALGQGICFALVAGSLGAAGADPTTSSQQQWSKVAITFVFVFFTVFGLTWIAVPWMYPAEVNTQQWRNRGAGVATATNWICNYAVVLATPVGMQSMSWRYYLIYAFLNFTFVPLVSMFHVETGGLSLEEVDGLFEKMGAETAAARAVGMPMEVETQRSQSQEGAEKDGTSSEWVEGT